MFFMKQSSDALVGGNLHDDPIVYGRNALVEVTGGATEVHRTPDFRKVLQVSC